MTPRTLNSALHIRDGGIDAMAALNSALSEALVGLNHQDQQDLKRAFGTVMGEISLNLINPAIDAFPVLALDEIAWASVAQARAKFRTNAV